MLGAVFTLARFSEAFLILRAQDVGLSLGYVPSVLIVMNVVYAAVAYPAGIAADRISRRELLLAGFAALIAADLLLAAALSPTLVFAGTACWGLHMALTQGLMSKLVADIAPARVRGTAFGVFNIVTGAALLLASAIAGAIWNSAGPSMTFLTPHWTISATG
jgi:MFS family permease